MREPRLYTTSADYAYQELRHRIITKQLKPGQRLPEVNIAVQMGVSRTPVREALRRLASEGCVPGGRGARICGPRGRSRGSTGGYVGSGYNRHYPGSRPAPQPLSYR